MESPGEYFKRERALRNISLQKVFEVTRVQMKYLAAIEADDIAALPGPTFVKGYIKAYCKYMGLDENDAVLRYEMFLREKAERHAEAAPETKPREKTPAMPAKTVKIAAAAAVGLVVVIAFVYFVSMGGKVKPPATSAPAKEVSAQSPPAPQDIDIKAAGARKDYKASPAAVAVTPLDGARKDGATPAPGLKHTLTLKANQTVWVRVRLDEREPIEATLKEGETVTWKADREFSLLFGNAGGVSITLDGVEMGAPGRSGQVLALTLPADNARPAQVGAQVKKIEEKPGTSVPEQAKPAKAGDAKPEDADKKDEKAQDMKPDDAQVTPQPPPASNSR